MRLLKDTFCTYHVNKLRGAKDQPVPKIFGCAAFVNVLLLVINRSRPG
jgi:hypothetical protein